MVPQACASRCICMQGCSMLGDSGLCVTCLQGCSVLGVDSDITAAQKRGLTCVSYKGRLVRVRVGGLTCVSYKGRLVRGEGGGPDVCQL